MTRKPYRLGRRGEAAEETRRRIVDACFAVHLEQGIAASTMKDVAERADVSIGTVYHHFPTYGDLVTACGRHAHALAPLPAADIFAGAATIEERVRRLAAAFSGYFEALPVEMVRCDQERVPALRPFVAAEEAQRLELARVALAGARAGERLAPVAAALLDVAVYRSLRRAGFAPAAAIEEIVTVILARLAAGPARAARRKA